MVFRMTDDKGVAWPVRIMVPSNFSIGYVSVGGTTEYQNILENAFTHIEFIKEEGELYTSIEVGQRMMKQKLMREFVGNNKKGKRIQLNGNGNNGLGASSSEIVREENVAESRRFDFSLESVSSLQRRTDANILTDVSVNTSVDKPKTPRTPVLDCNGEKDMPKTGSSEFLHFSDSEPVGVPITPDLDLVFADTNSEEVRNRVKNVSGEIAVTDGMVENKIQYDDDGVMVVTPEEMANYVATDLRLTMVKIKDEDIDNVNLKFFKNNEKIMSVKVSRMCHAQRFWLAVKFITMDKKEKVGMMLTMEKICKIFGINVPTVKKHLKEHKSRLNCRCYIPFSFQLAFQ